MSGERRPVQVLVYPIKLLGRDWEYLLLRRIPARGGFWQGVSGGVEENESLENAARRELIEETGACPIVLQAVGHSYSFPIDEEFASMYPDASEIEEHVFFAQIDEKVSIVMDPAEHDEHTWCVYEKALELLKWPENKKALTAVEGFLSGHRAKHTR